MVTSCVDKYKVQPYFVQLCGARRLCLENLIYQTLHRIIESIHGTVLQTCYRQFLIVLLSLCFIGNIARVSVSKRTDIT